MPLIDCHVDNGDAVYGEGDVLVLQFDMVPPARAKPAISWPRAFSLLTRRLPLRLSRQDTNQYTTQQVPSQHRPPTHHHPPTLTPTSTRTHALRFASSAISSAASSATSSSCHAMLVGPSSVLVSAHRRVLGGARLPLHQAARRRVLRHLCVFERGRVSGRGPCVGRLQAWFNSAAAAAATLANSREKRPSLGLVRCILPPISRR